jgi:hypothetical protein
MNERQTLPARRRNETFELVHGEHRTPFKVTVGFFANSDQPAEVFITGAKTGSSFEAIARDGAIMLSLALQYHIPLDTIRHAITRDTDGKPSTIVGAVVDRLHGDQRGKST